MEGGDGDAGGGAVEAGAEVEAEDAGLCRITYPHNQIPLPEPGERPARGIPAWGSVESRCLAD